MLGSSAVLVTTGCPLRMALTRTSRTRASRRARERGRNKRTRDSYHCVPCPLGNRLWQGAPEDSCVQGVSGAHVPHPLDLLRLASAAEGDGDAEACGALPERVAAGIVGLGLTLEADALHAALGHCQLVAERG